MDQNKQTVLLGVTGSIAAYKACELLRLLQKENVRVKVVMTQSAQELVGAATFRGLSGESVAVDLFDDPRNPIHHISLAQEADLFVIAPCTANVINKIANGVADDLLTTTALATAAPLVIAPAMNVGMLQNEITQQSLQKLEATGATIVGPGKGYLACGDEDSGRMSEPSEICAVVLDALAKRESLAGKRVLITAGPTREFLDPVRYISSPSSGKTGYALAREAARWGAEVVLVSGPTSLTVPPGVDCIDVVTAQDMLEATQQYFGGADIAIFSAAVADFKPANKADHKLKKGADLPLSSTHEITLTANPDILATMSAQRRRSGAQTPYVVGFAAETHDIIANAQIKLKSKGANLIIANDVSNPERGFASKDNQLIFVSAEGHKQTEVLSKDALAKVILDTIIQDLC